jgi:hypothetical protein
MYTAGSNSVAAHRWANANLNGLLATVRHRMAQNFLVVANYTYSHCLSSANFGGDLTGPTYQNPSNRNADYGSWNFDLRQNFNGSLLATGPKFANPRLDRPNVIGNPYLRNLNTRQWLNSSSFAANAPGTFGNAGSLSVIGPGYFDIDLSLSRSFRIVENQRLTVRAEFFNVLNHANFMAPTNSLVCNTFGVILASNDPRILQFSMKYTF